jgi:hypothetical protein
MGYGKLLAKTSQKRRTQIFVSVLKTPSSQARPTMSYSASKPEEAKPILDEFKTWLDSRSGMTPPHGLLRKAIAYTLNQWHHRVFLHRRACAALPYMRGFHITNPGLKFEILNLEALLRSTSKLAGDIVPDKKNKALHVRFHTMAYARSNRALKALCEYANEQYMSSIRTRV